LLLNGRGTLLAVGDDDQSVYSSRFADPTGITRFRERYPTATVRQLPVTSRLPTAVIDASHKIISKNASRLPRDKLIPLPETESRAGGGFVVSVNNKSDKAEAQFVHDALQALLDGGVPPSQILVLCTCRALGMELIERVKALDGEARIRIQDDLVIAQELGRAEYSAAHLERYLGDPHDNLAARVVVENVSNAHTGEVAALVAHALRHGISISQALQDQGLAENLPHLRPIMMDLDHDIRALSAEVGHRENALHLIATFPPLSHLAEALQPRLTDQILAGGGQPIRAEASVRFITLHASEGLDADFILIPFLEETLALPGGDDEERRRLFYVALTRAKVGVVMSWAWSRPSDKRFKCAGIGGDPTKRTPASLIKQAGISPNLVPLGAATTSATAAVDLLRKRAAAITYEQTAAPGCSR